MLTAVRVFWAFNKATVGGLLIAFFIAAAVIASLGSFGKTQTATGRIASFGFSEGKTGSHREAVVRVGGHIANVRVPSNVSCQIGNEIALVRGRSLLGSSYKIALDPEPCR